VANCWWRERNWDPTFSRYTSVFARRPDKSKAPDKVESALPPENGHPAATLGRSLSANNNSKAEFNRHADAEQVSSNCLSLVHLNAGC
jgi:hypothetical protein